ncbi:MAG: hypothetical protein KY461_11495 [Actinobacteria bacterium]|nr:hypothetical protein [Actinomycetota bacterium]
MTSLTLDPTANYPREVAARLDELGRADRERALRLLEVADRCCGGDVSVLVAIVEAVSA